MQRTYEIFEKFSDGCSLWRACVLGQFEALRKMQEMAGHSENQFLAIDLSSPKRLSVNLHPGLSHGIKLSPFLIFDPVCEIYRKRPTVVK
jgi:hypothetical protein